MRVAGSESAPNWRNTFARTVVQPASRHSNVGGTSALRPGFTLQSGAAPMRATGRNASNSMSLRMPMTVASPGSSDTPMLTCVPGTPIALPMVMSGLVFIADESVGVGVANCGEVRVGVAVRVLVNVGVTVSVSVGVGVSVGRVGVTVRVSVGVGVIPAVGVSVGGTVLVGVPVIVGVRVDVAVGDGGTSLTTSTEPSAPSDSTGWLTLSRTSTLLVLSG